MYLYLLSQDQNNGYDTYDACVVAAESEEAAKLLGPDEFEDDDATWTSGPEYVNAELLGEAKPGTEAGMILSSFNAG